LKQSTSIDVSDDDDDQVVASEFGPQGNESFEEYEARILSMLKEHVKTLLS
jgi:hypothetical protein